MISLQVVFAIIVLHFIADFVLQTDKQARGKSKNWSDLLGHTFKYSIIFGFGSCFILYPYKHNVYDPCFFMGITFICHTVTDYFTSRLNSRLYYKVENYRVLKETFINGSDEWNKYDKKQGLAAHDFFVAIGADQLLHYAQLFLTYYLLTK